MTKEELLDKYEHTFAGMVLDAWSQARTGEAQVIFAKRISPRAREMLSELFDRAVRCHQEEQARFQSTDGPKKELFGDERKKGKGKDVEV